mgnify:CR=1 FL=1
MLKIKYLNIALFALIAISLDIKSQGNIESEKYKVYSDAINQIQYEDAIRVAKAGKKNDTINYEPVVIHKSTIYETDSIGFFLFKSLKLKKSIFDGNYLNINEFAVIDNGKLIGLDTSFIVLYYMLDSLSIPGKHLSNSFGFKSKVIFTNQLKSRRLGLFRINWENFWDRFYQKHPNSFGIFEVSDVFFNSGMNNAILYIGFQRQGLVGYGAVYFLKKDNDKWTIIKNHEIWIS